MTLRIHLLGGFSVSVRGAPVSDGAWRLSKAKALVKLLALAGDRRLSRARLAARLWPDLPPYGAANNLRTTLHAARAALASVSPEAAQWIAADRVAVSLAPPDLWIDVAAFEEAATTALGATDPAECWRAVATYAGPLLPEDLYDDTVAPRRESLLTRYLAVLQRAADLHERRHEYDEAIRALVRVVETVPTHEAAHTALMRLYAQTGDRHRAVCQFQQLREVLRRELDTEPEPATRELYRQIVDWDFAWRRASATSPGADAAQPLEEATVIAVGPGPLSLAVVTSMHRIFVTMSGGRQVWAIDSETYEVVSRTETSSHPHGLAVNVKTERVYVANYMNRSVSMLDARTGERLGRGMTPEGKLPRGVAVDPATNLVYVTTRRNMPTDSVDNDSLLIFDGETVGLVASVAVGEMPMGVVLASASQRVYVAAEWSNAVAVVDTGRRRLIAMVPVAEGPCLIALDETAGLLYAVCRKGGRVSVVDCASLDVVATLKVGGMPHGVAVDVSARRVYVANSADGTVTVVDAATNTILGTIDTGPSPTDVALSPTGDRLFVTNLPADTVTVLGPAQLFEAIRPSAAARV